MTTRTANAPRVRVLRGERSPVQRVHAPALEEKRNRIRVAAYCRVSTDHEDQETSFEAQQTHFTNLISGNPGWELVGIYADEESGTRAQTRENFMRMIADCEAGKIDMVLSKSISRWARNTLDSLKYIRKLKALEIPIFFTKESINTMDAGGEVLVTILASIAQQESASISQNVQIGVRYHYQEGKVCSGVHRLLGYNRTPEGSLVIVPEEAEIVQRIFRDYLDGYSPKHIARMLAEEGVDGNKTTSGGTVFERNWNDQGITYILKNEKYSGDLLLQKYYTVDFLTKKVAPNNGQLPQYFVENSHEPVIPCGNCGLPYRQVKTTWRCDSKMNKSRHPDVECRNDSIRDDRLRQIIVDAFNALPERRDELVRLEERLRWGGLDKADEVLTRMETAMDSLEEEIREAQEAGNTDAEENARKQLAEVREKWAAASEQPEPAGSCQGDCGRKRRAPLPRKPERTVRETGSFLPAHKAGIRGRQSDGMLRRRYSPVYRESRDWLADGYGDF